MLIFSMHTLAPPVRAQATSDVLAKIQAINCDRKGDTVLVSYQLEGAFGAETRSTLESGQTLTFQHDLAVYRRRALWFRKTLTKVTVELGAKLDTLTQQYTLTRRVDERLVETVTTDRADEMERWLSEIRRFVLEVPPGSSAGMLDLKVKVFYRHDFLLFLVPWSPPAIDEAECR